MLLVESLIACFLMFTYLLIMKLVHKLGIRLVMGFHWLLKRHLGVLYLVDTTNSCAREDDDNDMDVDEKKELMPPEEVGEQIASRLLGEIEQGGVVDSSHQDLLFLLCALCPQDVSKIPVGKVVPYGIETLRNIRDFLGVKFVIKPDPATATYSHA